MIDGQILCRIDRRAFSVLSSFNCTKVWAFLKKLEILHDEGCGLCKTFRMINDFAVTALELFSLGRL